MDSIGDRIKYIRNYLKLNQKEMATELDVSDSHISGIERSKHQPSKNFLLSVCKLYGVDIDWLKTGKIPSTGIFLNNAPIINGDYYVITKGSNIVTEDAGTKKFKNKMDFMKELIQQKNQGHLNDTQFKHAVDELWSVSEKGKQLKTLSEGKGVKPITQPGGHKI